MRKSITHESLFEEWLYSSDKDRNAIETTAKTLYDLSYWGFYDFISFLWQVREYKKSRK